MLSHNGAIDTTHTPPPPPLSFYNTFEWQDHQKFSHRFVRPNYYILKYKFELECYSLYF
jgi:hypothetical protein